MSRTDRKGQRVSSLLPIGVAWNGVLINVLIATPVWTFIVHRHVFILLNLYWMRISEAILGVGLGWDQFSRVYCARFCGDLSVSVFFVEFLFTSLTPWSVRVVGDGDMVLLCSLWIYLLVFTDKLDWACSPWVEDGENCMRELCDIGRAVEKIRSVRTVCMVPLRSVEVIQIATSTSAPSCAWIPVTILITNHVTTATKKQQYLCFSFTVILHASLHNISTQFSSAVCPFQCLPHPGLSSTYRPARHASALVGCIVCSQSQLSFHVIWNKMRPTGPVWNQQRDNSVQHARDTTKIWITYGNTSRHVRKFKVQFMYLVFTCKGCTFGGTLMYFSW